MVKVLFWNVQGAICADFNRYLRLIIDSQGPDILALFVPQLWHSFDALRPGNDLAWVLDGDFNAITSSSERMGGSCRGDRVSVNFNDFIQMDGLNDLGFHGPQFARKRGTLHQRLDRCIGNDN
ncbi:hypothetical protein V6N13_143008 [Hibiscus sabdariffa]